jgi:heme/copper-type cytochrome/quinol oxidase subunit 3
MLILAIAPVNQSDNLMVKTDFIEVKICDGYWHFCHLIWLLPLSVFLTCLTFISIGKRFLRLLIILL